MDPHSILGGLGAAVQCARVLGCGLAAARLPARARRRCRTGTTTSGRPARTTRPPIYDVLSGDARRGTYELVVQASPFDAAVVNVHIVQSPVRLSLARTAAGFDARRCQHEYRRPSRRRGRGHRRRRQAGDGHGEGQHASGPEDRGAGLGAWHAGRRDDAPTAMGAVYRFWRKPLRYRGSPAGEDAAQLLVRPAGARPGRGARRRTSRLSLFPGLRCRGTASVVTRLSIRFYSDSAQALAPGGRTRGDARPG